MASFRTCLAVILLIVLLGCSVDGRIHKKGKKHQNRKDPVLTRVQETPPAQDAVLSIFNEAAEDFEFQIGGLGEWTLVSSFDKVTWTKKVNDEVTVLARNPKTRETFAYTATLLPRGNHLHFRGDSFGTYKREP